MNTDIVSERHPLYEGMLSTPELIGVLRFLAEVRKIFQSEGIEPALDKVYDDIHEHLGAGRFHVVCRLTYLVRCDLQNFDIANGVLSSSRPAKDQFPEFWLALWERLANITRAAGKLPERSLPGK